MQFSEYFGAWIRTYYEGIPLGRDFYTAVGTSRFFGGAIAKYILQNLESGVISLPLNIIDLGANNANLINDIRIFLETLGLGVAENCKFIAVESSLINESTVEQNIFFYKNIAELKNANILQNCHNIFIANEFFDALPCEIINNNKMAFVENNRLIFKKHNDKKLLEISEKFKINKGEISLSYDEICNEIKNLKFIFIVFDYGDILPRNDFSVRIFYKHKVQNFMDIVGNYAQNLSLLFGKCDITYSVPFFLLNMAFERIGAKKILSKRQDLALVEDFGILDLLQNFYNSLQNMPSNHSLYLHESNKIKSLLHNLSPRFHTVIYENL